MLKVNHAAFLVDPDPLPVQHGAGSFASSVRDASGVMGEAAPAVTSLEPIEEAHEAASPARYMPVTGCLACCTVLCTLLHAASPSIDAHTQGAGKVVVGAHADALGGMHKSY